MMNTCIVCNLDIHHREKIIVLIHARADYNRYNGFIKTYSRDDKYCHIGCINGLNKDMLEDYKGCNDTCCVNLQGGVI